ncbi:MFS transporter [Streptomyces nogalater]
MVIRKHSLDRTHTSQTRRSSVSDHRSGARPSAVAMTVGLSLLALNLRPAIGSVSPARRHPGIRRAVRLGGERAHHAAGRVPGCLRCRFPALSRRMGTPRALVLGFLLLIVGVLVRLDQAAWALFLGTALAGAGLAIGNVLMPAVIKSAFPDRVRLYTGIGTAVLSAGAALAAGVAVPLRNATDSWSGSLALWVVPAALGLVVWLPMVRRTGRPAPAAPDPRRPAPCWGTPWPGRSPDTWRCARWSTSRHWAGCPRSSPTWATATPPPAPCCPWPCWSACPGPCSRRSSSDARARRPSPPPSPSPRGQPPGPALGARYRRPLGRHPGRHAGSRPRHGPHLHRTARAEPAGRRPALGHGADHRLPRRRYRGSAAAGPAARGHERLDRLLVLLAAFTLPELILGLCSSRDRAVRPRTRQAATAREQQAPQSPALVD